MKSLIASLVIIALVLFSPGCQPTVAKLIPYKVSKNESKAGADDVIPKQKDACTYIQHFSSEFLNLYSSQFTTRLWNCQTALKRPLNDTTSHCTSPEGPSHPAFVWEPRQSSISLLKTFSEAEEQHAESSKSYSTKPTEFTSTRVLMLRSNCTLMPVISTSSPADKISGRFWRWIKNRRRQIRWYDLNNNSSTTLLTFSIWNVTMLKNGPFVTNRQFKKGCFLKKVNFIFLIKRFLHTFCQKRTFCYSTTFIASLITHKRFIVKESYISYGKRQKSCALIVV